MVDPCAMRPRGGRSQGVGSVGLFYILGFCTAYTHHVSFNNLSGIADAFEGRVSPKTFEKIRIQLRPPASGGHITDAKGHVQADLGSAEVHRLLDVRLDRKHQGPTPPIECPRDTCQETAPKAQRVGEKCGFQAIFTYFSSGDRHINSALGYLVNPPSRFSIYLSIYLSAWPGFSRPLSTPVHEHVHKCPALIAQARASTPSLTPRLGWVAC
eukprot:scaffold55506_cov59-Phaeocystis_antarctica.AAC.4